MERRKDSRIDCQVIVHFHCRGHEKVVEVRTRNVSTSGMYVDTDPEILDMLEVGSSVITLVEYQPNFLVRLKGYVVRVDSFASLSGGFAVKFLDLDEKQQAIIHQL